MRNKFYVYMPYFIDLPSLRKEFEFNTTEELLSHRLITKWKAKKYALDGHCLLIQQSDNTWLLIGSIKHPEFVDIPSLPKWMLWNRILRDFCSRFYHAIKYWIRYGVKRKCQFILETWKVWRTARKMKKLNLVEPLKSYDLHHDEWTNEEIQDFDFMKNMESEPDKRTGTALKAD